MTKKFFISGICILVAFLVLLVFSYISQKKFIDYMRSKASYKDCDPNVFAMELKDATNICFPKKAKYIGAAKGLNWDSSQTNIIMVFTADANEAHHFLESNFPELKLQKYNTANDRRAILNTELPKWFTCPIVTGVMAETQYIKDELNIFYDMELYVDTSDSNDYKVFMFGRVQLK